MVVPLHLVHRWTGGFLALICVPLILRIVPMNHVYGVRIPQSYESERNWYAINAFGGWLLFLYGLALFAFSFLGRDLLPPATSPSAPLFVMVPFLLILPLLVIIRIYARRL